ncbi:MAG: tetratricopeptide repeat protein [Caldilineaceae bacterium]|nr:tetratricopeptide repeat protein [Caldilineaceae bacterium]
MVETPSSYIPTDRRLAMSRNEPVPAEAVGAVLFADISGFTPLTEALAHAYGPLRGADELTRHLNDVYGALIERVHAYGGSVIGFSGDAITCWFGCPFEDALLHATAAALAMHADVAAFGAIPTGQGSSVTLAIKTSLIAGRVRRFVVGDPRIQLIDVLVGDTLTRMAEMVELVQKGDLLLDEESAQRIVAYLRGEWRTINARRYFAVHALTTTVSTVEQPSALRELTTEEMRAWILPALYERMEGEHARFLAELRPAVALFLIFDGIDFENDPHAGDKFNTFVTQVQQIVHRYEGALIQLTTGDKGTYLYAAFGAPIAHDDDTYRAVAVALEIRRQLTNFPFIQQIRIGISQGRMRVGAYGSEMRRTYGVLGDEVNLAARLMMMAQPGQILISGRAAASIVNQYQLDSLGSVSIRGKSERIPLFALLGERERLSEHLGALYATPLVGRDMELAQISALTASTLAGQGQIVRLVGSAGVGKSHLAATVVGKAQAQSFQVAAGVCLSTETTVAYASVRQIARQLLGIAEDRDTDHQIEYVTSVIGAINPTWLVRVPLLADLLGLPIADNATTSAFDSQLRQQALIALAVEIVRTRARQQPLLILFEDIHWIDEASLRLLTALSRVITDVPILLLLLHRPWTGDDALLQELSALDYQTVVDLNELSEEGVAALIRHRLGGEVAELTLSLISTQAQGNPFFVEELVDALRESGDLVQQKEKWMLSAKMIQALQRADCLVTAADGTLRLAPNATLTPVDVGLPDSIYGLVLARLDRLAAPTKLTLKVASVVGRVFDVELLTRVHPLGVDEPTLLAQLETLNRRDFARVERPQPRLSYIFKHNITQEVVYRTLLESQQQALHLAIADQLEQLQPDAIEQLAFHYRHANLALAQVRGKALDYLGQAGDRARRRYANETALNYYDRALTLASRWNWLAAKADVLHILGRRDEESATLELLAQQPEAPPFEVHFRWGEYFESMGEYPRAEEAVQRALDAARQLADLRGQVRSLARLGLMAWRQGDYEAASQHYQHALDALNGEAGYESEEAEVRYGLGLLYRQQGEYNTAGEQLNAALGLHQATGDRQEEARTLIALGGVDFLRRSYDDALSAYRQALSIRRTIGDRSGESASLLSLAQAIRSLGDYAEAEKLLRTALAIQQSINDRWLESVAWNELGVIYMLVGQYASAEDALAKALALSEALNDEAGVAYALCNLGQIQREQRQLAEAEATLRRGLDIARSQEDRHLEALYLNDLGFTSHSRNDNAAAVRFALESLTILRDLSLHVSATSDLALLAVSYLALGQHESALANAEELLALLDGCNGEGPDFPQRDYLICYRVLGALGDHQRAQHALDEALRLLSRQADRISAETMRSSFLHAVAANAEILAESADKRCGHGLGETWIES